MQAEFRTSGDLICTLTTLKRLGIYWLAGRRLIRQRIAVMLVMTAGTAPRANYFSNCTEKAFLLVMLASMVTMLVMAAL